MRNQILLTLLILFCCLEVHGARIPFVPPFQKKECVLVKSLDGTYCGVKIAGWRLFQEADPFRRFWGEFTSNQLTPPPAPTIDFSKYVVAMYCFGETLFDGHRIEMKNVRVEGGVFYLPHLIQRASWKEATLYEKTSPWVMFFFEKLPFKGHVFQELIPEAP